MTIGTFTVLRDCERNPTFAVITRLALRTAMETLAIGIRTFVKVVSAKRATRKTLVNDEWTEGRTRARAGRIAVRVVFRHSRNWR